jgi:hypothetical protein
MIFCVAWVGVLEFGAVWLDRVTAGNGNVICCEIQLDSAGVVFSISCWKRNTKPSPNRKTMRWSLDDRSLDIGGLELERECWGLGGQRSDGGGKGGALDDNCEKLTMNNEQTSKQNTRYPIMLLI